ncbi:hypothetical protein PUN28_003003 [Cardiocondyla obscurior]|uniref:Uncharacterized protein n=1 Tax=Cardiocondyla obscurior TaxID=286306 RepID=A0AAW2GX04_9HYME
MHYSIEHQFPVNEFVKGTAPHKQEPGESTAGGTGDLVLIRDRHFLSIQEHRANMRDKIWFQYSNIREFYFSFLLCNHYFKVDCCIEMGSYSDAEDKHSLF